MARPGAGMDVDLTLNRRSLGLSDAGGVAARGELVTSVTEAFGIRVHPGAVAWDMPSGAQPVVDSAFSVGGAASHGAGGARWGVWGSGDVSQFSGDFDGFRHVHKRGRRQSHAHGFTGERVSAQLGEALLSWLGAAGQRAELWSGGGVSLAAKSDGFVTGVRHSSYGSMPVSAHAWRARLLVEAGLESRPQDALLSGLVELGARLDGGDASASRTPASAWGSRPSAGT